MIVFQGIRFTIEDERDVNDFMISSSPPRAPLPDTVILMASRPSSQDPDSRTSSVGRKRGFNQFTTTDDQVITITDDSSGEESEHLGKRPRHDVQFQVTNDHPINVATASNDVITFNDSSESASSLHGVSDRGHGRTSAAGQRSIGGTAQASVSWNQGVPSGVRTSFGNRNASTHKPSPDTSEWFKRSWNAAAPGVGLDLSTAAEVPKSARQLRSQDTTADLPAKQHDGVEPLSVHDLSEGERDVKAQDRRQEVGAETSLTFTLNDAESSPKLDKKHGSASSNAASGAKSKKTEKKAKSTVEKEPLTQKKSKGPTLPRNAFGLHPSQMLVQPTIDRLPEDKRNLMPRPVKDDDLFFTCDAGRFKLPGLPKDQLIWPLSKVPFHGGFAVGFMENNSSLLEKMSMSIIGRAFRKYLDLFYGHLPQKLINVVVTNIKGKKTQKLLTEKSDSQSQNPQRAAANTKTRTMETQSRLPVALPENSTKVIPDPESQAHTQEPQALGRMLGVKRTQSKLTSDTGLGESNSALKTPLVPHPGDSMEEHVSTSHVQPVQMSEIISGDIIADRPKYEATGLVGNRVSMLDSSASAPDTGYTDTMELELLHRYHPGLGSHSICLTCAQPGHRSSNCPLLTCTTCGLRGLHFTDACPQTQRCTKCRGRGHQKSQCPEKLAVTSSDGVSCDICRSATHLESSCHFLWRSFRLSSGAAVRLVSHIPINCYTCGADGHFGPECGVCTSKLRTDGYTWSKANWQQYVDPKSRNRAPALGKDYSLPMKSKKSFAIKGRAQNDYVAADDDSDDVQFIGKRVAKPNRPIPKGNQHIKFSQAHRDDDPYHYAPPPLPKERPSPLPTRSYRPQEDSGRYRRERSFSPPPRYPGDYQPRPGDYREPRDNNYRPGENAPAYRDYGHDEMFPRGRGQDRGQDSHDFRGAPDPRGLEPVPAPRGGPNKRKHRKRGGAN